MPGGPHPPVSVVESWPSPNYVDPVRHSVANVVIIAILGAFALLAVVLRVWSRFKLQKNVGLDDWVFLAGMPCAFAYAIGACLTTRVFHEDRHIWDITSHDAVALRKIHFTNCILYVISTTAIKMSVLCFYRRLTDRTISATFIYVVWACMISEVACLAICFGTVCFGCNPTSAYWNKHVPTWVATHSYSCVDEGIALFAVSVVSVIQDFIATVLPFTLFLKTKLAVGQKIALSATFAVGLLVVFAGSYRAVRVYRSFFQTYDMTWSTYYFVTSSAIEILLAIIVASAPALKYYIRHAIDARRTSACQRNNNTDPFPVPKELNRQKHLTGYISLPKVLNKQKHRTDYTMSTIKSFFSINVRNTTVDTTSSCSKPTTPLNSSLDPTVTEISGWQDDVVGWQIGRSISSQEDELLTAGIISTQQSDYFNRDKRCWVTNDPRPVHYPWEDFGPEEFAAVNAGDLKAPL